MGTLRYTVGNKYIDIAPEQETQFLLYYPDAVKQVEAKQAKPVNPPKPKDEVKESIRQDILFGGHASKKETIQDILNAKPMLQQTAQPVSTRVEPTNQLEKMFKGDAEVGYEVGRQEALRQEVPDTALGRLTASFIRSAVGIHAAQQSLIYSIQGNRFLANQIQGQADASQEALGMNIGEGEIGDAILSGDIKKVAKIGVKTAVRSAPITIMWLINPVVGAGASFLTSAANKYVSIDREHPELANGAKIGSAVTTGVFEAAAEHIGNLIGMGGTLKAAKTMPQQMFKQLITKKIARSALAKIPLRYGIETLSEGGEEAVTFSGEYFGDVLLGIRPYNGKEYTAGVINAGLLGAAAGGVQGGVTTTYTGLINARYTGIASKLDSAANKDITKIKDPAKANIATHMKTLAQNTIEAINSAQNGDMDLAETIASDNLNAITRLAKAKTYNNSIHTIGMYNALIIDTIHEVSGSMIQEAVPAKAETTPVSVPTTPEVKADTDAIFKEAIKTKSKEDITSALTAITEVQKTASTVEEMDRLNNQIGVLKKIMKSSAQDVVEEKIADPVKTEPKPETGPEPKAEIPVIAKDVTPEKPKKEPKPKPVKETLPVPEKVEEASIDVVTPYSNKSKMNSNTLRHEKKVRLRSLEEMKSNGVKQVKMGVKQMTIDKAIDVTRKSMDATTLEEYDTKPIRPAPVPTLSEKVKWEVYKARKEYMYYAKYRDEVSTKARDEITKRLKVLNELENKYGLPNTRIDGTREGDIYEQKDAGVPKYTELKYMPTEDSVNRDVVDSIKDGNEWHPYGVGTSEEWNIAIAEMKKEGTFWGIKDQAIVEQGVKIMEDIDELLDEIDNIENTSDEYLSDLDESGSHISDEEVSRISDENREKIKEIESKIKVLQKKHKDLWDNAKAKPKLVKTEWRSKLEDVPHKIEGSIVARRSDWDKSLVSELSGREIVHVYWIDKGDGEVKPYGIQSAAKIMGWSKAETDRKIRQLANEHKAEEAKIKAWRSDAREHEGAASPRAALLRWEPLQAHKEQDFWAAIDRDFVFAHKDNTYRAIPKNQSEHIEAYRREGWDIQSTDQSSQVPTPVKAAEDSKAEVTSRSTFHAQYKAAQKGKLTAEQIKAQLELYDAMMNVYAKEMGMSIDEAYADAIESVGKIPLEGEARTQESTDAEIAEAERQMDSVRKQYEGTEQWLKAPNGKPTNLNERQWLQVRTKAFKDWFGDWENDPKNASKVIDDNGEPLVVYHGTMVGKRNENQRTDYLTLARQVSDISGREYLGDEWALNNMDAVWRSIRANKPRLDPKTYYSAERYHVPFTEFDFNKKRTGAGSYDANAGMFFTPNDNFARRFTYRIEYDPYTRKTKRIEGSNPHIYSTFLVIKNPLNLANVNIQNAESILRSGVVIPNGVNSAKDLADMMRNSEGSKNLQEFWAQERVQEAGYDGIINKVFDESGKSQIEIQAFSPTQIKSATANVGTFDPANPDIRYQQIMRGYIQNIDGKYRISLLSPDISTGLHEQAHLGKSLMQRMAKVSEAWAQRLKDAEGWCEVKNGEWTAEAEEKFAKGYEKYLIHGTSPTSKLATVFAKIKQWMQSLVYKAKDIQGIEINSSIISVYNALLGIETKPSLTKEQRVAASQIKQQMAKKSTADPVALEADLDRLVDKMKSLTISAKKTLGKVRMLISDVNTDTALVEIVSTQDGYTINDMHYSNNADAFDAITELLEANSKTNSIDIRPQINETAQAKAAKAKAVRDAKTQAAYDSLRGKLVRTSRVLGSVGLGEMGWREYLSKSLTRLITINYSGARPLNEAKLMYLQSMAEEAKTPKERAEVESKIRAMLKADAKYREALVELSGYDNTASIPAIQLFDAIRNVNQEYYKQFMSDGFIDTLIESRKDIAETTGLDLNDDVVMDTVVRLHIENMRGIKQQDESIRDFLLPHRLIVKMFGSAGAKLVGLSDRGSLKRTEMDNAISPIIKKVHVALRTKGNNRELTYTGTEINEIGDIILRVENNKAIFNKEKAIEDAVKKMQDNGSNINVADALDVYAAMKEAFAVYESYIHEHNSDASRRKIGVQESYIPRMYRYGVLRFESTPPKGFLHAPSTTKKRELSGIIGNAEIERNPENILRNYHEMMSKYISFYDLAAYVTPKSEFVPSAFAKDASVILQKENRASTDYVNKYVTKTIGYRKPRGGFDKLLSAVKTNMYSSLLVANLRLTFQNYWQRSLIFTVADAEACRAAIKDVRFWAGTSRLSKDKYPNITRAMTSRRGQEDSLIQNTTAEIRHDMESTDTTKRGVLNAITKSAMISEAILERSPFQFGEKGNRGWAFAAGMYQTAMRSKPYTKARAEGKTRVEAIEIALSDPRIYDAAVTIGGVLNAEVNTAASGTFSPLIYDSAIAKWMPFMRYMHNFTMLMHRTVSMRTMKSSWADDLFMLNMSGGQKEASHADKIRAMQTIITATSRVAVREYLNSGIITEEKTSQNRLSAKEVEDINKAFTDLVKTSIDTAGKKYSQYVRGRKGQAQRVAALAAFVVGDALLNYLYLLFKGWATDRDEDVSFWEQILDTTQITRLGSGLKLGSGLLPNLTYVKNAKGFHKAMAEWAVRLSPVGIANKPIKDFTGKYGTDYIVEKVLDEID